MKIKFSLEELLEQFQFKSLFSRMVMGAMYLKLKKYHEFI